MSKLCKNLSAITTVILLTTGTSSLIADAGTDAKTYETDKDKLKTEKKIEEDKLAIEKKKLEADKTAEEAKLEKDKTAKEDALKDNHPKTTIMKK